MRRRLLCSLAPCLGVALALRTLGCEGDPPATGQAFADTDGDGLSDVDERVVYGTSPILSDTDGDGLSDYEELISRSFDPEIDPLRFNPLIADIPLLEVEIIAPPVLSLRITATNGETWSFETVQTDEQGIEQSVSTTQEQSFALGRSRSESRSTERSVQSEVEADASPPPDAGRPDGGVSLSPSMVTVTQGYSTTLSQEQSDTATIALSDSMAQQWRQAVSEARGIGQSHEISASGAVFYVLAVLHNRGNLSFRVSNLLLAATFASDDGSLVPITNLEVSQTITTFDPYSIVPGGRQGPVNFVREGITLEQCDQIAQRMDALLIGVGIVELEDENGKSYAFDIPRIASRTARVRIDYGDLRPSEQHWVATNVEPGRNGISLGKIFRDVLRVPFEKADDGSVWAIRGERKADGSPWQVRIRSGGPRALDAPSDAGITEFDDSIIRAGDVVEIQ